MRRLIVSGVSALLLIILACSNVAKCEYILSIELNKFNNPAGLLVDGTKCPAPTCLTYFRFCLKQAINTSSSTTSSSSLNNECLSQFETDIIGANVIGEEQFQLTTNSIRFRLNSTWNSDDDDDDDTAERLFLLIQVLNYDRPRMSNDQSTRLISEWKLPIRFFKLNKWIRYENSINYKLRQVFLFDYRLQCADDYYGPKCEFRYFGANCDLALDEQQQLVTDEEDQQLAHHHACTPPCQNGGRCLRGGRCQCDPALYGGAQCEVRIVQACATSTTCMNGASCLPTGECLCAPGYIGERCQIKRLNSQCGAVTCYNGGTCFIDNRNEYACLCHSSFRGRYCQTKVVAAAAASVAMTIPFSASMTSSTTKSPSISAANKLDMSAYYFTVSELIMIILVGVGMPMILVVLTFFLCRLTLRKPQYDKHAYPASSLSTSSTSSSSSSTASTSSLPPLKAKLMQAYQKQQHQRSITSQQHHYQQNKQQNIYVTNLQATSMQQQQQDPNTVYASLYEEFVPTTAAASSSKAYCVMSSIV